MTADIARIVLLNLPWPPTATSPNASGQGKWRQKAKAARSYKEECGWICRERGVRPIGAAAVSVTLTFCPPSRRKFDLDNALARAKQGLDAVAEAIGVDDSRWQRLTLDRGEACKDGGIIVLIEEAS